MVLLPIDIEHHMIIPICVVGWIVIHGNISLTACVYHGGQSKAYLALRWMPKCSYLKNGVMQAILFMLETAWVGIYKDINQREFKVVFKVNWLNKYT